MKTRKELFETSLFQAHWTNVVKFAIGLAVPLNSTPNMAQNIFRLKKAIVYVNDLILASDKDLVPVSVWQNFDVSSTNIESYIQSFINAPDETHIDNSNVEIDNLLQYLSPYVITGKGAAQAAGRALSAYATSVEEYTEMLNSDLKEALSGVKRAEAVIEVTLEQITSFESKLKNYEASLLSDDLETPSIKTKVSNSLTEIKDAKNQILQFRNELIGEVGGEVDTIVFLVNQGRVDVLEAQELASKNMKGLDVQLEALDKLHADVFGKKDEKGKIVGGLRAEYKALTLSLEAYENKQRGVHEAILTEAKELLPSATAAGLASAYAKRKEVYAEPIKIFGNFFYFALIILFIIGGSTLFTWSQETGLAFGWPKDWTQMFVAAFARTPLVIPVIWLAYFSAKRRNENRRLEEEYAHKQAFASSYYSFRLQIEKLDEQDQPKLSAQLLSAAIHSVAFNASSTLDKNHEDNLPNTEQLLNLERTIKSLKDIRPKL